MNEEVETDFNEVVHSLINATIKAKAVKSEIVLQDNGYQLTFTIDKLDE